MSTYVSILQIYMQSNTGAVLRSCDFVDVLGRETPINRFS